MSLNNLPVEWSIQKFEKIVFKIVGGGTPSKNNPEYYLGNIPWMSVKDMNKNILEDTVDHITQEAIDNSATNLIPKGTPIIATRMSLGKVVVANFDSAINQDLKAIFLDDNIDKNFFVYWYRSQSKLIESLGTGTTVKGIRLEVINNLDFPVVPLAEQQEIVRQLDVMLAQVEQIKARLDAIPAILKKFRQSVLAEAVSGKLTEDWRAQNSSSYSAISDHSKIIEDRIRVVKGKNSKPEQHLKNEEYLIPDSWLWTSLDTLTSKIVDGTHHTPTYIESGVPFISVKDIYDGRIDFSNTKYISEEEHKELSKRCNVEKGDLLITKSGTIGRTAIVTEDREFSLFVSVALLKPASSEVNLKFINLALQKWVNEIDVSSRIVGSAIKNLHLKDMRVLAIPFAPLKEQEVIVDNIETFFKLADHLEDVIASAQKRVNLLTQSILAKAFSGELTAEWREQHQELITGVNSAESLLAKIQAEREASKPVKKAKKVK